MGQLISDSSDAGKNNIYRGQTNAEWGLIPGIHRQYTYDNWEYDYYGIGNDWSTKDKKLPRNSLEQATIENVLLSRFSMSLEKSDFSISELYYQKNTFGSDRLYSLGVKENSTFQNPAYEDLTSIAQHYGIPTRMLDWSKDYLVSLFFALQPTRYNYSHFSVFSLDTNIALSHLHPNSIFNKSSPSFSQEAFDYRNTHLGFLNIIYAQNHLCPNMKAQRGCLSFLSNKVSSKLNFNYDLVEYIGNLDRVNNEAMKLVHDHNFKLEDHHQKALAKYVFHPKLGIFIYKWLNVHNIHEGTIFPDLNGIAAHTKQVVRTYKY